MKPRIFPRNGGWWCSGHGVDRFGGTWRQAYCRWVLDSRQILALRLRASA